MSWFKPDVSDGHINWTLWQVVYDVHNMPKCYEKWVLTTALKKIDRYQKKHKREVTE